jgi:outer membrane protein OmpA-like peptidoglycan-associated protein
MAHFNLPDLGKQPWVDANGAQDVYDKFKAADPAKPNAFVLWEPFVSKALENPAAHVLIDSSKFRGYIVDVLVVQRKYLLEHEEQVRKFVECYLRAAYAARQAPGGMQALVAADAQAQQAPLTPAQAANLAQRVWWKNTQENFGHFGLTSAASPGQGLQHLDEIIRNIVAVLVKTGGMAKDPTNNQPNAWYYDKVFRQLRDAKFHPGVLIGVGDGEALRPQAALAPLNDAEWESLVEVGALEVDPLVFARGTSKLTEQSKQTLDHLRQTLDTWPQYYLIVRGNARREGDPAANRKLSQDRAAAAADYLLQAGVAKQRIRATATEGAVAGGEGQSVSFVLGQKPY